MDFFQQTSGTWVNFIAVIIGTALGVLFGNRMPPKMGQTLMQVLALITFYSGLDMANSLTKVSIGIFPGVIVGLVSLALGAVIGEALALEERLNAWGEALKNRLKGQGRFTEGFVTACLLFCVGPMTLIGSLQNGLSGDPKTTLIKATLDFISSVALSSVYGIGVGLSAFFLLLVQGGINLAAGSLSSVLPDPRSDPSVLLVTGVGGVMILGIAVNLLLAGLNQGGNKVRTASLLPALFLAPLFVVLSKVFG